MTQKFNLIRFIEDNPLESSLRVLAREIENLKTESLELIFEKIHPEAKTPEKAYEEDACFDVFTIDDPVIESNRLVYRTGLRFQIPEGYSIDLYPRSSVSKTNLFLANSVGIVDTGYRGEFIVSFKCIPSFPEEVLINQDENQLPLFGEGYMQSLFYSQLKIPESIIYKKGDKIAQIRLVKKINCKLKEGSVSVDTERSDKGWGSSGK